MPDLDGGHYFLTVLAPVRVDHVQTGPEETRSHAQLLALQLSVLPVGRQTSYSPPDRVSSPFARNTLNHTARFTIIDSLNFNGRLSGDTLLQIGSDPLKAQPVDRLATPYLLFAADIDAGKDGEAALRAYTEALWVTMRDELQRVFGHCHDYEAVTDAAGFHAYIKRCQVETTLSFNDYWAERMPAPKEWLKVKGLRRTAKAVGVITAVWLLLLIAAAALALTPWDNLLTDAIGVIDVLGVIVVPLLILTICLWGYWIYWRVLRHGRKPFPVAPNSDLPSILKAIYLQQAYARFAAGAQGLTATDLHARFGEFLARARPDEPQPALQAGECYPELTP